MDYLSRVRSELADEVQLTAEEEDPSLMVDWIDGPFVDNGNGTFDCTFNHPVYGPIPFTASPNDSEAHGRAAHAYILTRLPSGGEGG